MYTCVYTLIMFFDLVSNPTYDFSWFGSEVKSLGLVLEEEVQSNYIVNISNKPYP